LRKAAAGGIKTCPFRTLVINTRDSEN